MKGFLVHQTINAEISAGITEFRASFAGAAISAYKLVSIALDTLSAFGAEPTVCFTALSTMIAIVCATFNLRIACITFGTMVIIATLAAQSANVTDPIAPCATAALYAHRVSAAAHTAIRTRVTDGLVAINTCYFAMLANVRAVIASPAFLADIIYTAIA